MPTGRITITKVLSGDQYTVDHDNVIGSGDVSTLYVENPSDSDKTIILDSQRVLVDGAADGEYYRNPDISGGSDTAVVNDLLGDGGSSVVNAKTGVTFTGDSVTFPISESNKGDALTERPSNAILPGNSIGFKVASNSASNTTLIQLIIWETSDRT